MGNTALEEKDVTQESASSPPVDVMTESAATSQDSSTVDCFDRSSTLAALSDGLQEIKCSGKDSDSPYQLNSKNVKVVCSAASNSGSESASNQVRISQVSKFDWEQKLYNGNLVACNSAYIAYVVRVKVGDTDHVRILNHRTSSRALIKCFKGKVNDLAFSGPSSDQLACVDDAGYVTLIDLTENEGAVNYHISLQLQLNINDSASPETNRLFWSLSLPEVNAANAVTESRIIAVTNGNSVEVFDIQQVKKEYVGEPLATDGLQSGIIRIKDGHEKSITKVVISPEESVLATSSLDGFVKFWQMDFQSTEKPECLHDWKPHDGEPVTELIFCDNQFDKSEEAPPMWRFLITGTKNNSVLKLSCAVTWNVLQTVSFTGGKQDGEPSRLNPGFKIAIDLSGSYLLLSDVTRQVLYVCNFVQDAEKGIARLDKLSEFVLTQPLLSFIVHRVKHKLGLRTEAQSNGNANDLTNGVHDKSNDAVDDRDGVTDDTRQCLRAAISVFGIHTRALQRLNVQCTPSDFNEQKREKELRAESSQDDISCVKDGLSDTSSVADSTSIVPQEECPASTSQSTLEEKLSLALESLDMSSLLPTLSSTDSVASSRDTAVSSKAPDEELPDILASSSSSVVNKISSLDVCLDKQPELSTFLPGPPDMVQRSINRDEESSAGVATHEPLQLRCSSQSPVCSTPNDIQQRDSGPTSQDDVSTPHVREESTRLRHTASFEQSPIKLVNIPSEQSFTTPTSTNRCCADALDAMRAENREMCDMLAKLLETTAHQQELTASQLNDQRNEREAMKVEQKAFAKAASANFNKSAKDLTKAINAKFDAYSSEARSANQESVAGPLRDKMVSVLKESVKESVLPSINNMARSSLDKMNAEVVVKMSVIEKKLKEDIEALVRSKEMTNAMAQSMQRTMTTIYKEEFRNNIVPAFQKACATMMKQLNDSFSEGTSQYLAQVEAHLSRAHLNQDKSIAPLTTELKKATQLLQENAIHQPQSQDAIGRAMDSALGRFNTALGKTQLKNNDIMKSAFQDMLDGFVGRLPSNTARSMSPSMEDIKESVFDFVQKEEFSKAFELALSVTSLPVVTFVCDQVDPIELFDKTPCPLSQPIILSLIQQLSADLGTDTTKKTKYITQAIYALDLDDNMTSVHLNDVVTGLLKQIQIIMEEKAAVDPHNPHLKSLKNLRIAANGVSHGR